MAGAKEYYKMLAEIDKRNERFETYGEAVEVGGAAISAIGASMGEKKQAWEDVEAGIGVGEKSGLEFETEGMVPGGGVGGWFKRHFTSPEGTIAGTDPITGKTMDYGVEGLAGYGKSARGAGFVGGMYDPQFDRFRDSLWDGQKSVSPKQVVSGVLPDVEVTGKRTISKLGAYFTPKGFSRASFENLEKDKYILPRIIRKRMEEYGMEE